jgi:hypothetical protein
MEMVVSFRQDQNNVLITCDLLIVKLVTLIDRSTHLKYSYSIFMFENKTRTRFQFLNPCAMFTFYTK